MGVIAAQVVGLVAFLAGTLLSARHLRHHPDKATAERTSRVMHALFFAGLSIPGGLGLLHPGPRWYDELLGVPSLRRRLAGLFLVAGSYLMVASNVALRRLGHGANAFRLTTRPVTDDIYEYTRNPMSLGYYLLNTGAALLSGSTVLTAAPLLAVMPAHLFFLKHFEEREVEPRLGKTYLDYKERVPFLIPSLRSKGE